MIDVLKERRERLGILDDKQLLRADEFAKVFVEPFFQVGSGDARAGSADRVQRCRGDRMVRNSTWPSGDWIDFGGDWTRSCFDQIWKRKITIGLG